MRVWSLYLTGSFIILININSSIYAPQHAMENYKMNETTTKMNGGNNHELITSHNGL